MRFELTEHTRDTVSGLDRLSTPCFLLPGRNRHDRHVSRQYALIVQRWVSLIGLDPTDYGTHSLRRTKATPEV